MEQPEKSTPEQGQKLLVEIIVVAMYVNKLSDLAYTCVPLVLVLYDNISVLREPGITSRLVG